ncbi:US5 [anatid alphaherpesvirus 1]|nr:US5 [Anatid alphaherpesvirus 1]UJO49866.1 US5 [Anatid alphaherpesvirus 1]UJO49941.1 US5 [Anatid alphaherpesvirus 1]WKE35653.1 glycoprotein J [Anatid alphaherpesvirus 1]
MYTDVTVMWVAVILFTMSIQCSPTSPQPTMSLGVDATNPSTVTEPWTSTASVTTATPQTTSSTSAAEAPPDGIYNGANFTIISNRTRCIRIDAPNAANVTIPLSFRGRNRSSATQYFNITLLKPENSTWHYYEIASFNGSTMINHDPQMWRMDYIYNVSHQPRRFDVNITMNKTLNNSLLVAKIYEKTIIYSYGLRRIMLFRLIVNDSLSGADTGIYTRFSTPKDIIDDTSLTAYPWVSAAPCSHEYIEATNNGSLLYPWIPRWPNSGEDFPESAEIEDQDKDHFAGHYHHIAFANTTSPFPDRDSTLLKIIPPDEPHKALRAECHVATLDNYTYSFNWYVNKAIIDVTTKKEHWTVNDYRTTIGIVHINQTVADIKSVITCEICASEFSHLQENGRSVCISVDAAIPCYSRKHLAIEFDELRHVAMCKADNLDTVPIFSWVVHETKIESGPVTNITIPGDKCWRMYSAIAMPRAEGRDNVFYICSIRTLDGYAESVSRKWFRGNYEGFSTWSMSAMAALMTTVSLFLTCGLYLCLCMV